MAKQKRPRAPSWAARLQAAAAAADRSRRVIAAVDTTNGRGWLRLCALLEESANDPLIAGSPGASSFLQEIVAIAHDSLYYTSGYQALRDAVLFNESRTTEQKVIDELRELPAMVRQKPRTIPGFIAKRLGVTPALVRLYLRKRGLR